MAKIELIKASPKVTPEGAVAIDIQAALLRDRSLSGVNEGLRVPNISFKIRSGVFNASAVSGDNGVLEVSDLHLDTDGIAADDVDIEIIATHLDADEVGNAVGHFRVNIREQLRAAAQIIQTRQKNEEAARKKIADELAKRQAEADRLALKQAQYEAMDPERKRQIKDRITRAGEDIKSRTRLQIDPFNTLREYADHPHAIRTAHMVAAEAAERTIEAVAIYKSAPWAFEVMQIATSKEPQGAIDRLDDFKDMEWAPEILKVAAQRFPHQVINAMPKYCQYPWNKDVVMDIAGTHPQAVFETALMWEYYKAWAEEVAMCAANKAPEFAMNNFKLYQDQPWAERVYKAIAVKINVEDVQKAEQQRLLKKKITDTGRKLVADQDLPQETRTQDIAKLRARLQGQQDPKGEKPVTETRNIGFAFLYEHRFHPHTTVVMTQIAERIPVTCIETVSIYKSAPWAEEIMKLATEKSPLTALANLEKYSEMQWAQVIMEIIATKHPREVIRNLSRFAEYKWAKGVLSQIANSCPSAIFEEMEYIEYFPWAEEVTEIAATQNPEIALKSFSKYEQQPWASAVVHRIEQRREEFRKRKNETTRRIDDLSSENRQKRTQRRIEEESLSRRNFIFGIVAAGIAAVGGVTVWKAIDFKKRIERINLADIEADPEAILLEDIHSILTDGNLLRMFGGLNYLFDKTKDGSYKYDFPRDVLDELKTAINGSLLGTGGLRVYQLDAKLVSDGLITINLTLGKFVFVEGHSTGLIFKEYYPGGDVLESDSSTEIPDWLTLQIKGNHRIKITLKPTQVRPIAESIEFQIENNTITDVVHTADIQTGLVTTVRAKVMHDAADETSVREKRRQRAAAKKLED